MKTYLTLFLLLVLFNSCEQKSKVREQEKRLKKCLADLENTDRSISAYMWRKELFDIDKSTINGTAVIMRKDALIKIIGQPDRIINLSTEVPNNLDLLKILKSELDFTLEKYSLLFLGILYLKNMMVGV